MALCYRRQSQTAQGKSTVVRFGVVLVAVACLRVVQEFHP